jgi:hypothetical protein
MGEAVVITIRADRVKRTGQIKIVRETDIGETKPSRKKESSTNCEKNKKRKRGRIALGILFITFIRIIKSQLFSFDTFERSLTNEVV